MPNSELKSASYEPLTCPLPGCGQYLYVSFEHYADLYRGTLDDREPLKPSDGDVSSWKVECVHGHIILVPADPGCGCDDDCSCDVDPSEEVRTFRASDVDRLRLVLDQLSSVTRPYSAPGMPPGAPERARGIAETMPTVGQWPGGAE